MIQVVLYIASSLDGYIARKNGSIDWLPPLDPKGEDYGYNALFKSIDVLVMGSATYEQILTFGDWPYVDKHSYVFTKRRLNTTRNDVSFISCSVEQFMQDINKKGYKRLWLVGGSELIADFMQHDLVDAYIITMIPVLLGEGIPLFKQGIPEIKLQFMTSKHYPNGICELRYEKS